MAKMQDPGRKDISSKVVKQITQDTPVSQPITDALRQQQPGQAKVVPS